ncbi:MAG: hypothetical protein HY769_04115 [Candidatus Stahlbacteria bacterium]|nr:hypothetical protein [Candidatus Stahlbacteria bacterium]
MKNSKSKTGLEHLNLGFGICLGFSVPPHPDSHREESGTSDLGFLI